MFLSRGRGAAVCWSGNEESDSYYICAYEVFGDNMMLRFEVQNRFQLGPFYESGLTIEDTRKTSHEGWPFQKCSCYDWNKCVFEEVLAGLGSDIQKLELVMCLVQRARGCYIA